MTSLALGYQTRGPAAVIALPERAEAGTVFALRSRSERALSAGHRWIAVDLRAVDHIDNRASPDAQERPRWKPRHSAPARPSSLVRAIAFQPESDLRPMMINLPGDRLPRSLLRGSRSRSRDNPPQTAHRHDRFSPVQLPRILRWGAAARL